MRDQFLRRRRMRSRRSRNPLGENRGIGQRREVETGLPAAEQFEIDGSEQAAIDLRAMLDPLREIDVETPAQGVETRGCSGKSHARQGRKIGKRTAERLALQPRQFGVEESQIEFGVVND